MVASADLIVGLERMHVREAIIEDPNAWPRTYTLREIVRRGSTVGPRRTDQPLEEWLALTHLGRQTRDLLGSDRIDDVADPTDQPDSAYERTATELGALVDVLADLVTASISSSDRRGFDR